MASCGSALPTWYCILIVSQTCPKFCYIRIQDNFLYFISVLLSSQCNDQALAHIERARASTLDTPWLRIWQNMLAYPISKGAVGMRLAQRQPIRRRRPWLQTGVKGWMRQRVSDGRDNFCSDIVLCPPCNFMKSTCFFFCLIKHCDS